MSSLRLPSVNVSLSIATDLCSVSTVSLFSSPTVTSPQNENVSVTLLFGNVTFSTLVTVADPPQLCPMATTRYVPGATASVTSPNAASPTVCATAFTLAPSDEKTATFSLPQTSAKSTGPRVSPSPASILSTKFAFASCPLSSGTTTFSQAAKPTAINPKTSFLI